ncbi:MAG: outer membrane beta-barrel protein [Nitrospinota bacterium]
MKMHWLLPMGVVLFAVVLLFPPLAPAQVRVPFKAKLPKVLSPVTQMTQTGDEAAGRLGRRGRADFIVAEWDYFVAVFVGAAIPLDTDLKVTDLLTLTNFTAKDVELDTSASIGGKMGAWWTGLRPSTSLDFGAELDVTRFAPDINSQGARASGTFLGIPIISVVTNRIDLSATIFAVNLMARWPLGLSPGLPHGRWHPYVGIGGGFEVLDADPAGPGDDRTMTGVLQVLTGLKYFVTRYFALFGEYKYTHGGHTFQGVTGKVEADVSATHIVGGVAVHFPFGETSR